MVDEGRSERGGEGIEDQNLNCDPPPRKGKPNGLGLLRQSTSILSMLHQNASPRPYLVFAFFLVQNTGFFPVTKCDQISSRETVIKPHYTRSQGLPLF